MQKSLKTTSNGPSQMDAQITTISVVSFHCDCSSTPSTISG